MENKNKQTNREKMVKSMAQDMEKFRKKERTCPECGKLNFKKFNRSNYPYGKKSKHINSSGKQCRDCNYIKYGSDK